MSKKCHVIVLKNAEVVKYYWTLLPSELFVSGHEASYIKYCASQTESLHCL